MAVFAVAVSTLSARDDQRPDDVAKLKQIIEGQQKRIELLERRVAKLEETHRILRFDQYVEAAQATKEIAPVQPSGKPVSSKAQLKAGDRVLVEWRDTWWKGEVLEVLPDGDVKIRYVGWDAQWDEVVPRKRLQHPAQEADTSKNEASTKP